MGITAFCWAASLAILGLVGVSGVLAADGVAEVPTRDLNGLHVPGKVVAVLWTVRAEHCTLQVVFANAGRIGQVMRDDSKGRPERPRLQVWLLKADGTVIAPSGRIEPGNNAGTKDPRYPYGVEINFVFPLSADQDAIAAAVQVDDGFYIEPLGKPGRVAER